MAKKRLISNLRWTLKKHRDLSAYAQNILSYMSENSATSGFHGVSEIVIMNTTNTPLGELKKALQDLDRNGWISIGNEEVYLVHGTYKRSANSLVQLNDESNPKSKGKFTNSAHDAVWNDLLEYVIFFDQSVIHFEFKEFFDAVSETVLIDDGIHQDIGAWDVSSVENMSAMFKNNSVFNQDIGAWGVGNVLYMEEMFKNATAFN
ncbi:BspA family leucine-rich repeat surface protein [Cyclobacteriaceae bacterium]|nr:BspA family leucine-rich repeat surface protein [Cyclobacteriaceae bacterium]MDB4603634.1 BspA family leucine-rich repeat surface protein [Cyclobacteriaceae bacterium]MDC1369462.1 BspA family leucine-rich repeat surface protein [Cyclobacteriaceae bacterium]